MNGEAGRASGRVLAIDIARGIAVLMMIAAHAADAFLADTWRHNEAWYGLDLLFGFVAPAFMFLSGVTLYLALRRREEGTGTAGMSRWPVARRLLGILAIGYWLQIPNLSLRQLIYEHRPDELARLFDSNILQVIALSGLVAMGLAWLLRSAARGRAAALAIGIAGMIATPYLWSSGLYQSLPLPLRFYLAPQPPATFSLLPMLAYFMIGFALARMLMSLGRTWRGIAITIASGGALAAAGLLLDLPLHAHPPHDQFWSSSAQHILFRTGGLFIMMALCFAAATFISRQDKIIAFAGRRSLAIYILHLMLFYGSPVTMGMRAWFGGAFARTLGPLTVVSIVGATLIASILALRGWDWLGSRHPGWARWSARLAWGAFFGVFLLKP